MIFVQHVAPDVPTLRTAIEGYSDVIIFIEGNLYLHGKLFEKHAGREASLPGGISLNASLCLVRRCCLASSTLTPCMPYSLPTNLSIRGRTRTSSTMSADGDGDDKAWRAGVRSGHNFQAAKAVFSFCHKMMMWC